MFALFYINVYAWMRWHRRTVYFLVCEIKVVITVLEIMEALN